MVRIAKSKLIIEIPTGHLEPLAVLADYQRGILDLISVVPFGDTDTATEHRDFGMLMVTSLMREMMLVQEQASCLNGSLTEEQIIEMNKWVK